MRANQRAHVNEESLIGCLFHALYETSTTSTQQRFFALASRALQEAGLGVTRAIPLPLGAWPAESGHLGTCGGECAGLWGFILAQNPGGGGLRSEPPPLLCRTAAERAADRGYRAWLGRIDICPLD